MSIGCLFNRWAVRKRCVEMIGLLVTVTVLLSVILILLVVGLAVYFKRLAGATRELEVTLKAFREEIMPLAEEAGRVLRHTNELVIATRMQVDRVGRAAQSISVMNGIREGVKTLRSAKQSKEESIDE
jgi:uncharacterized protein YoxC